MTEFKTEYFYMKVTAEQKAIIREQAKESNMNMSEYVWFLVTMDLRKKK